MIKILVLAVALLGANAYYGQGQGRYYYNYFPSQNLFQSPNYFNHGIYYGESKYQAEVSYVDSTSEPNGELNNGDDLFYLINFTDGTYRLHKIVVEANEDSEGYVTQYRLQSSLDGDFFFDIMGGAVYQGINNSTANATFYFPKTVYAKQLRFIPTQYFSLLNFRLTVYYDDDEIITPFQDRVQLLQRTVRLRNETDNATSTNGGALDASALAGYEEYKFDRFNNVRYFSPSGSVGQRDTSVPEFSSYEELFGLNPYEALGGEEPLREILVYVFDELLTKDPVVGPFFSSTDANEHKALVLDFFISMLGGGDDRYKGLDMETAHTGMAIISQEYDRFVGLILRGFNDFSVPFEILQEVSRRLEFYREMVENK